MHQLWLCCLALSYHLHAASETSTPIPNGTHVFFEPFDDHFNSRWIVTTTPEFQGQWEWATPAESDSSDHGLMVQHMARKSAIRVTLPEPLQFKEGSPLVVQYEVKLQSGLQCGGAYIKLLSEAGATAVPFDNTSPYIIMFGPDRCGTTDRCHFILKYKNPVTGEFVETAANLPPAVPLDTRTHVYTLVLYPDDNYEMFIDLESRMSGSLLEDMTPPINPPPTIDDPEDKKPEDWVDEAEIPEPGAVKPDDWDESQPPQIPDPEATKPDDWDESVPADIPDPVAEPPENWIVEEDGVWEAPRIPNPDCPSGECGPWTPPMVDNPQYKGRWKPSLVPNPAYKGPWQPRQIANPAYFEEKHPVAQIQPIHGIGIELWSMQSGMLFDNILLSHDLDAALDFARATWTLKHQREVAQQQPYNFAELISNSPTLFWVALAVPMFLLPIALWWLCGRSSTEGAAEGDSADEQSSPEQDEPEETTGDADRDEPSEEAAGPSVEPAKEGLRHREPLQNVE